MAADTRRTKPTPGRIPLDRALPGLDFPDVPSGVDSEFAERTAHAARTALYWKGIRQFRRMIEEYNRDARPPYEHREIVIRIIVGADRVGAVVDWRDGRLGRAGLLRRVAGPLRVSARAVRGAGPGVSLQIALRSLLDATDSL